MDIMAAAEATAEDKVMTAAEYAESVNQWLHQAHQSYLLALGPETSG